MDQIIEITGVAVGLIYIWLEYRASIYLWIAGIIMPAIYIYVYYKAGLYADFGINVYYLIIALYGWLSWKYGFSRAKQAQQEELPITYTPRGMWVKMSVLYVVTQLAIVYILLEYTDSNVAWGDAFTTALSIVGMYMLAKKYIEQWWVWFVVDAVCCALYVYKELYFTAALYALYATICIFGYRKWKTLMAQKNV